MPKTIRNYVSEHRNKVIVLTLALIGLAITIWGVVRGFIILNVTGTLISSLYLGSIYLCLSLGLTMTYKIVGFANFAHAEYFLVGGYIGVAWSIWKNENDIAIQFNDLFFVILIAFVFAGLVALLSDFLVYEPLRKEKAAPETLMITSIGVGIIIRNIVALIFSGDALYFRWVDDLESFELPSMIFGGRAKFQFIEYYLVHEYLISILVTIVLVFTLIAFLQYTRTGKALRATSDNKDLAESSGINTKLMIRIVWFVGGGLAGVAGALYASKFPMIPLKGFQFLLPAFAVVVFAGVGSISGSIIAAYVIAFAQQLSHGYLAGLQNLFKEYDIAGKRTGLTSYNAVIPFVVIIIVLIFKPYGIYGEPEE